MEQFGGEFRSFRFLEVLGEFQSSFRFWEVFGGVSEQFQGNLNQRIRVTRTGEESPRNVISVDQLAVSQVWVARDLPPCYPLCTTPWGGHVLCVATNGIVSWKQVETSPLHRNSFVYLN